jgi:hypothetical protein
MRHEAHAVLIDVPEACALFMLQNMRVIPKLFCPRVVITLRCGFWREASVLGVHAVMQTQFSSVHSLATMQAHAVSHRAHPLQRAWLRRTLVVPQAALAVSQPGTTKLGFAGLGIMGELQRLPGMQI